MTLSRQTLDIEEVGATVGQNRTIATPKKGRKERYLCLNNF